MRSAARGTRHAARRMSELHAPPPPPLPLFFSVHSGTGNQLQALTSAVFVANATGRALFVPPWLAYRQMNAFTRDPTRVVHRNCRAQFIDKDKQKLSRFSEYMLCDLCKSKEQLASFASVYAIHELVRTLPTLTDAQCKYCRENGAAKSFKMCPRMDLDMHQLVLEKYDPNRKRWHLSNAGEDPNATDCSQNLLHLRPTGAACARMLRAVDAASNLLNRTKRQALCLGPLNDWFFEKPFGKDGTITGRCSSSYPLAKRLARQGLPLRQELIDLIPRLFPEPCDVCVYARLPDKMNKSLATLHEALYSISGRRFISELIAKHLKEPAKRDGHYIRPGAFELVSSCTTPECRNPFQNSTSGMYQSVTKFTRQRLALLGPLLLAKPPDEARLRDGWEQLRSLGIGPDNQRTLYDQLRCARCRTIRGMAAGSNRDLKLKGRGGLSARSTFYETITLLHHQLRDRGVITGKEIKLSFSEEQKQFDHLWVCNNALKGKERQCHEYTKPFLYPEHVSRSSVTYIKRLGNATTYRTVEGCESASGCRLRGALQ